MTEIANSPVPIRPDEVLYISDDTWHILVARKDALDASWEYLVMQTLTSGAKSMSVIKAEDSERLRQQIINSGFERDVRPNMPNDVLAFKRGKA